MADAAADDLVIAGRRLGSRLVMGTGGAANLAVLERDPFSAPADQIGSTRVVATYVEGANVFRAGSG